MDGINIDNLTIEQYLRLTQENQTPSMVKNVDDMTIAEYIEYFNYDSEDMELDDEAGYTTDGESVLSEHKAIDFAHTVNTQSFKEELSSEEDLDEWAVHKNKQIRVAEADLKKSSEAMEDIVNNDSFTCNLPSLEELNPGSFILPFTINNYNSYVMANIDASNNVMPRSIYEYMNLTNLRGTTILVEMDDMTQQETLGTVKNVLVKINKFEFPCDFVVTDMPENLGEMIILGRPFLETIHAQIDVFQEEISLGIGEDRIKFDINGNPSQSNITIEKNYMENTSQEEESFNPLEIGQDLFSYESPACLQLEQDTRNYDTIAPHN
ncbi:reverse transcriptase domain-containing protein [Tanacetum coccineum]